MTMLTDFYEKHRKKFLTTTILLLIVLFCLPFITTKRTKLGKAYTEKNDVALYVMQHHELPPNYITKYGSDYLKDHSLSRDGYIVGGDTHVNLGELENKGVKDARLKECDVAGANYSITNRGTKRLVYTCNTKNVRVFYTNDHYKNFSELTEFKLQLPRNICRIVFGVYTTTFVIFYCVIVTKKSRARRAEHTQLIAENSSNEHER